MENEFTICRGEKDPKSTGKDFSTDFQEFTLKTNRDLFLTGVTFFGPHGTTPETSKYKVTIVIQVSSVGGQCPGSGDDKLLLPKSEQIFKVEATRGQKFLVNFENPVLIPGLIWVDIKFILQGPKTEHLLEKLKYTLVYQHGQVRMDCLIGSLQLADLHFEIPVGHQTGTVDLVRPGPASILRRFFNF